jgi:type 1 fimbriae regulatory protein FimB
MQSLSKPQLLMLLAAARASRERDWLMILVCFWHGLRVSELVGFKRDAIQDGYLTIKRLKGSDRTVQMLVEHPEPLLNEREPLIDFASKSNFSKPVFNVSRRRFDQLMKQYGRQVGIPAHLAHAHTLKHTIARLSIESAGIEHVRRWLGHKSMSSTGEYLKVSDAEAGQRVATALGSDSGHSLISLKK